MLELVNAPLLLYFTVICSLSALVPYLIKPMLACLCCVTFGERDLWTQILKLKAEQKNISMKDEFATYSRMQRKIIKLEAELKQSSQSRASKNIALNGTISVALQGFFGLLMFCSVVWFRYEPLVRFHVNLTPFVTMLSYPTSLPNSLSAHMWVVVSNYSIRSMLKTLTA